MRTKKLAWRKLTLVECKELEEILWDAADGMPDVIKLARWSGRFKAMGDI